MGAHYLDYAATSAIRPAAVADAMHRFIMEIGATAGRGGHRLALEAGRIALHCRMALTRVLGLPEDPGRIALTLNATHGINAALWGLLGTGDVVVTTAYDHNAVLRPLALLEAEMGVKTRSVSGAPDGTVDMEELGRLMDGARLLVVNAASNVLGTRLPLAEMSAVARQHGALVLVDAAQWGGHFFPDLAEAGADLVAFTGHKGLLGPQGIGGLWVRSGVAIRPHLAGGTGGDSMDPRMPAAFPDRLEPGSGNVPGMAGLLAGIEALEEMGIESVHRNEMALKTVLWEGLNSLQGIRVLSPLAPEGLGIVTVVSERMNPPTLAGLLDQEWGVLVRHGLNCAPGVHRMLGTEAQGAVRFSVGWATTEEDVLQAIRGVDSLTSGPRVPVA